nr:unnamed protein product [Digitaria exilis]
MAAVDAAEAVVPQMPVEPPPIAADAVVEPPPIAADAAAETVVEPPPVAADAVVERPPEIVADAMDTVGTPLPEAADDEEAAAAAPMSAVPPPPPPPEQKLEQKIQSVMHGGEEPLPSEIHKIIESIEVQLPSIADDQKPCDMTIQKQPEEETVQRSGHLLVEDQLAMDSDDLSDDSPTRNSNDDSDYSDGAYHLISSNFERGVQQDAQEFLCDLLEKLDEASIAPKSSLEEPSLTEGGIAKEIFGGLLKSQLRCPKCNRCSDKSEPFLDLSLEVTMVDSLIDALQSFTKVELIEDYMCDGCKCRVNMEKHFKIEQAPEVLVIHLKRFTNSGGKICDKVKYPLELHVDSFMSSSDDTQQKYDLYGVVVHHGIYGRGHYVCYIRSSVDD